MELVCTVQLTAVQVQAVQLRPVELQAPQLLAVQLRGPRNSPAVDMLPMRCP